ncbi:response regulator [Deinococcus sonorensis]|uniref:Response regulator n=2 Tax=Deinococcus sonorensis TaxID=309891 RepID=A0AAU7U666_9DEIO
MPAHSLHLLVIDDLQEEAELFRSAVEEVVPEVRLSSCTTAEQALALLAHDDDRPDLILLDVNLPGVSGLELLQRIKTDPALQCLPVIMMSTSSMPSQITACYRGYANAFLVKPPGFQPLMEAVEGLIRFWSNPALRLPPAAIHRRRSTPFS